MRTRTVIVAALLAVVLSVTGTGLSGVVAQTPGGPVAGSVQQVYRPGDATRPSEPVADYEGDLLTLQAVDVGQTAAEPTIGLTADGTAFFAASTLVLDTPVVYGVAETDVMRSSDGGVTWESVQVKIPTGDSVPPGNADPFVWVDPDTDRIFNIDLYAGCSWLNFSDDKGETWLANPAACGNYVNDHQTITSGKPRGGLVTLNYPNVVYYCFNRVIDSNCGRSLDGGLTWTPTPQPAFFGYDSAAGGLCGGLHGHIRTDPDGRLFLPKGHCGRPWIAVSEDSGNSWTRVRVADMPSAQPHTSVASDAAGNLYYVWFGGQQRLPYLSISRDNGKTWGEPMMIAPPAVGEVNFPVVTAGDEGRIAVNFPGSAGGTASTRPWNQYVVVSDNALDDDPIFLSATANDPADPVRRGACNGRCAGMWDFLDIQVSAAGQAWATASDDCLGTCVTQGAATSQRVGRGIAVRQIGGPSLRAPAAE